MTLTTYRNKRNFKKTSEPYGEQKIAKDQSRQYLIQKHAASHLHYDFRLELGGVLKSWAVPKGPSLDPSIKRLAVHVEDHPLDYGSFEGTIPKGEYGGGTVMLWDKGTWQPQEADTYQAYEKGHMTFKLLGTRLKGLWKLIRLKNDPKNWLLMKVDDVYARRDYDITQKMLRSVVSKRSMDEISKHILSPKRTTTKPSTKSGKTKRASTKRFSAKQAKKTR